MPTFDNDTSLMLAIYADMENVFEDASNQVTERVRDFVEEAVYNPFSQGKYKRLGMNGGFLGSWRNSKLENIASLSLAYEIYSDPNLMVYDPILFQHGNMFEDRRDIMDEAIEEGTDYDFDETAASIKRDYWSLVLNMLEDGSMDKIIKESFYKSGIEVVKS
jgi:hypothetical protein